jgi:hypothetical protein
VVSVMDPYGRILRFLDQVLNLYQPKVYAAEPHASVLSNLDYHMKTGTQIEGVQHTLLRGTSRFWRATAIGCCLLRHFIIIIIYIYNIIYII